MGNVVVDLADAIRQVASPYQHPKGDFPTWVMSKNPYSAFNLTSLKQKVGPEEGLDLCVS